MKKLLVALAILSMAITGPAISAGVRILPPLGDAAPAGVLTAPTDAETPGTADNKAFLRASSILGIAVLIGGEKACSLTYDSAKIASVIDREKPPRDKTYHAEALRQIAAVKKTSAHWSSGTIARICGDVKKLAAESGLIPPLPRPTTLSENSTFADFAIVCRTKGDEVAPPCTGLIEAAYAASIHAQPESVICDPARFWQTVDKTVPNVTSDDRSWGQALGVVIQLGPVCRAK